MFLCYWKYLFSFDALLGTKVLFATCMLIKKSLKGTLCGSMRVRFVILSVLLVHS